MNLLDRILYEPQGGMFREFEGLTTHFKPKDMELYRKLLPARFPVPSQPVVTIFVADYIRVQPWPMSRYQEWSVLLKTECAGEVLWYSATMPVTRRVPMMGGRRLGFPKYIIDEITVARNGDVRIGVAKHKGVTQLRLQFHPGTTRLLQPWEQELMDNTAFFKGDAVQLVPPGEGPRAQKVILRHMVPPKWAPEPGMFCVLVDASESWKSMLPDEVELPGTYNHFVGGINLVAEPTE